MARWQECSAGVSCASLVALTAVYVTCYAVPYWAVTAGGEYWGLWQRCGAQGPCVMWSSVLHTVPGRVKASQALLTVGLIPLAADVMSHLIWLRTSDTSAAYRASRTAVTCSLTAGVIGGTGVMLFGVEYSRDPLSTNGWAFWLCAGACACLAMHAAIFASCACKGPKEVAAEQKKVKDPSSAQALTVLHAACTRPGAGSQHNPEQLLQSAHGDHIPASPAPPSPYTAVYQSPLATPPSAHP